MMWRGIFGKGPDKMPSVEDTLFEEGFEVSYELVSLELARALSFFWRWATVWVYGPLLIAITLFWYRGYILQEATFRALMDTVLTGIILAILGMLLLQIVSFFYAFSPLSTKGAAITSIGSEGLFDQTELGTHSARWRGIGRIKQNKHFIFFLTSNFVWFYFVPKRAFASPEEAD